MTTNRNHTHSAPVVPSKDLRDFVTKRSHALGLTRDSLALRAGVGRSTLFDWLSGTGQPSAAGWRGLASALQMRVSELFDAVGVPLQSEVERARLERGWTRGDLASHAGVSFTTVRSLEQGRQVRPDAAGRVAEVLDLEPAFVHTAARVSARATTPLGRALEQERLTRGWTIAELARHLGTARQLVSAWLLGTEPIASRWFPQLADFTGMPVEAVTALAAAPTAVAE